MAIGEFGGAPAVPGGVLASTPLYWLYELTHAALNPARAVADATRLAFRNPINPLYSTSFGKSVVAAAELFERSTRRYGQPEWRHLLDAGRRRTGAGAHRKRLGATVLPAPAFRAGLRAGATPATARLLIVAPLSGHYATLSARYRRSVPAQSRCLYHRMARCAHGAAVGRHVRARRLHRLHHLHPARARRRHACGGGVSAGGAGARRRRLDGRRRRSLSADHHDA